MAMTVPSEIVATLAGWPEVASWEPMFPLLTVDDSGFPHVCLLSRAELQADAQHVYAVLASPTTLSNLRQRPVATLLVVLTDSACYLKLRAVHIGQSGPAEVVFEVTMSTRDSLAIPLRAPQYLVAASLPAAEAWERSAELLTGLVARYGTHAR
jgi:hypothetical protein